MAEYTEEQREALWRCYQLILEYGRSKEQDEQDTEAQNEIPVEVAGVEPNTVGGRR